MIPHKLFSPLLLLFIITFHSTVTARQKGSRKVLESRSTAGDTKGGIFISGRAGLSYLATEIYRNLSGTATEFSNQPGPSAGLEVSYFLTPSLETGADFSYSFLKGLAETPDFSAVGNHHTMLNPPDGPVRYNNRLYGPGVFARYYFGQNVLQPRSVNFFMNSGIRILFNESELLYTNRVDDAIIFGKGRGKYKTTQVVNGVFSLGGGLSYPVSEQINLKMAANINMVGYDFLDVVHNYDEAGNRKQVIGLFTEVTAGVSVKLKNRKRSSSARSGSAAPHLPFSR